MPVPTSVPWVRFAFVVLLTSSSNVAAILVPPYLRARDYDYTAIGLLVALTGMASLCSRFPAGAMYSPSRARKLMVLCIVVMAGNFLLYPLAQSTETFALVQLIAGFASGVSTTTNLAMFMDSLPAEAERHRVMAIYAGALSGGNTVGNLIGGVAGDSLGFAAAFWIAAATTLASLVFLVLDPPAIPIASSPAKPRDARPLRERLTSPFRAMAEPRLVVISLVAFLLNFLQTIVQTFFPLYGISIGMSLSEIGLLKSVHSTVNTIARPLASVPVRKLGARRASFIGLVMLAIMDTLVPFQTTIVLFVLVIAGIGLMRAIVLVSNTVELADLDHPGISRGMASGLYNSSQDLGSLTGPALCGALASVIGLTTMMTLVPLGSTALFFLILLGLYRKPGPGTQRAAA